MQLVECVPNFSEGRRQIVIDAIRRAAETVPDVTVLDVHSDGVHNRTVLTFVGSPAAAAEAAFRCTERAAALIDMREQRGEHPRIGATDVIPFVPVWGVDMNDCVALANQLGERVGLELQIPVYLYAEAARRPERRWLPTVRKGQYEGLQELIRTEPDRAPDFGPARLGPAGATAIGARPFLVAYNVNLACADLQLARDIARTVRESGGGLPAVQARGMATSEPDVVQVSLNLLDTSVTPLHVVFGEIRSLARANGVEIQDSEVVGLLPLDVLLATTVQHVKAFELRREHILEARLLAALSERREAPPA
jgi:glutamate formiminotransferase / 5-formyltetrahydrofolate cyclo-ligase